MYLENKFLFIGKVFLVIFVIINFVNIFPIDIFNVFYYSNISNIILDTSTLLLLGLAIPRFLFIKRIINYTNIKNSNPKELEDINRQINKLQKKENINYILTKFCFWVFIIILIVQPINLIFVLNRNDVVINRSIDAYSNALEIRKKQIFDMPNNSSNEINEDIRKEKIEEKEEIIKNLNKNFDQTIDNFIKKNNTAKLNQIKFIIRNIFTSCIWAFAFQKLSKIHFQE